MKIIEPLILEADPIITEVRRVKTALAAEHNFDVLAMVRALQEREKKQKCELGGGLSVPVAPAEGS